MNLDLRGENCSTESVSHLMLEKNFNSPIASNTVLGNFNIVPPYGVSFACLLAAPLTDLCGPFSA